MKREHVLKCATMFLPVLLVFSLVLGIVSDVSAQKKTRTKESSTPKQLTPSEEAGVKLLALQSKGYIDLQIAQPSTFLLIERKVWGAMMHKDKVDLCRTALTFLQGLKKEQSKKIDFLIVWDMTSHDTIARGYIDENRIEILK